MKAFLRLKGKIRPRRKLSAVSDQTSALSIWQFIKYFALDKVRYLRTFLQSILVFVSCSAALAQESVVHTTPANQAEATSKTTDTNITPLKIGDKIPDELWEMYFPVVSAKSDEVQYLSLGDFKDKLIILDFWATWCAPCISSLHKLDTLQEQFKEDLMVIPASYEPESKIRPFLTNRKIDLPSLIEEKELKKYFPHISIPYQVWIKDGVFLTTAQSEYANFNNLTKIINNKEVKILQKDEPESFDIDMPLIHINDFGAKLLYHSVFTTRVSANIFGTLYGSDGISGFNSDLVSLFEEAFSIRRYPLNSRVLVEVSDPLLKYKILGPSEKSFSGDWHIDTALRNWKNENTFSYSIKFPKEIDIDTRRSVMQQELNNFFGNYWGVKAKVEQRKVKCLALLKLGDKENFLTKGLGDLQINNKEEFKAINQPIEYFINRLSISHLRLGIPIINATGYDGNIDLHIKGGFKEIDKLNEQLKSFGLILKEIYHEVPMLIIFQS